MSLGQESEKMIASPQIQASHQWETPDGLKPLLVLGMGRGGTTLLMQLLSTSSHIAYDRIYPFEVRYLTYLLRWSLLLGQQWQPGSGWDWIANFNPPDERIGPFPYVNAQLWDGRELWPKCFGAAWKAFSQVAVARMQANGKTAVPLIYYAEKIPFWVPAYLRQVIPYSLILLVRDPRDVFLSITAFDKKRGFSGFSRRADDDDWTFARRFVKLCRERFKTMREEEAAASSIVLKYERLAVDLAGEAQRLSQWLGVRLDAGWVENQVSNFAHHVTTNSPRESVERWRRELPAGLNKFFLKELGGELRHFGYES
jgi:hypothetical protein